MKEAIRYLGYGRNTADERTRIMIENAFTEVERASGPKSICRVFDVMQTADKIKIGNMEIISSSLARNLKGCTKAVIFGATLGSGVLRPRFSPGYGDFDIRYQKSIMRMLDCAKNIGLTMTDSYMMTPTKSVTAVIGASPVKERCPIAGCEACARTDCAYRR